MNRHEIKMQVMHNNKNDIYLSFQVFDAAESSTYDQQGVCFVVAHELAHQWFGNLVTLEWWNDLW